MANPYRNEDDIELGGKEYRIRATFNTIAEIEDYFDEPLFEVLTVTLNNGHARIKQVQFLVMALVKGAGDKPNADEIADAIATEGVANVLNKVAKVLMQAFKGATPDESTGDSEEKK